MKTNGKEFKAFYNDQSYWPEDAYVEEMNLKINGVEQSDVDTDKLLDEDQIRITYGSVVKGERIVSLTSFFKKWRKQQSVTSVVVEIDNDKLEAIKELLKDQAALLQMRDNVKRLHDELYEIYQWATLEKAPLRQQEIDRIEKIWEETKP